jgi:DNA-directed RNA polymerase specialized sigma24 family protein
MIAPSVTRDPRYGEQIAGEPRPTCPPRAGAALGASAAPAGPRMTTCASGCVDGGADRTSRDGRPADAAGSPRAAGRALRRGDRTAADGDSSGRECDGDQADDQPTRMSIDCLTARCQEEARRRATGTATDGACGLELFRRALVGQDQCAWEALERVYGAQLARWARGHRLFRQSGEEAEALANRALERLWRRVGPSNFDAFPNLSSLLGYLHRCVDTAVIDQARWRRGEERRIQALGLALDRSTAATPDGRALDRAQAEELWAAVRGCCRDEREEWAAHATLVLSPKPSDLPAVAPAAFGSAGEVNALLGVLRRRLSRSPALRRHLMRDTVDEPGWAG